MKATTWRAPGIRPLALAALVTFYAITLGGVVAASDEAGTSKTPVSTTCDPSPETEPTREPVKHFAIVIPKCPGAGCPENGSGELPPVLMKYYGGHMLSNPRAVQVLWGAGNYDGLVGGNGAATFPAFYQHLLSDGVLDWLSEYSQDSQTLGRGTFYGTVQLTVSSSTSVTDHVIQQQLKNHMTSGALPPPDDNTVYLVNFPQGVSITLGTVTLGTAASCDTFCGYHSSFALGAQEVYYAVLPDLSAGKCALTCNRADGNAFDNQTFVAAHELVEAITDPDANDGDQSNPAFPLAWYDALWGEVADPCSSKGLSRFTVAGDPYHYGTTRVWSNALNGCAGGPCSEDPLTCFGKCGVIQNACGGTIDCPNTCVSPSTCGGGGVEHVCGCTPRRNPTCAPNQCPGLVPDGCGGKTMCTPGYIASCESRDGQSCSRRGPAGCCTNGTDEHGLCFCTGRTLVCQ